LPRIDWLIMFGLLAALTIVNRWRRSLRALDAAAYRTFSSGLVLVALASLLRLFSEQELLRDMHFIGEPLFGQLLMWVIVITGVTLMMAGLAGWIPLARRIHRADQGRLARLNTFRHVEQLASIEPRVEPFIKAVLVQIIQDTEFSRGLVLTCSARGRQLKVIDQYEMAADLSALAVLQCTSRDQTDSAGLRLSHDLQLVGLPSTLPSPAVTLPVIVRDQVRAAFILYRDDPEPIDQETLQDLKLTAEIIARRIADSTRQLKLEFYEHRDRLLHLLKQSIAGSKTVAEALTTMVRELQPMVRVEVASLLYRSDSSGGWDRVTAGRNDTQLVERGIAAPASIEPLNAMCSGRVAEVFSLSGQTADTVRAELPGDIRAVAVLSLPTENGSFSLVILGSRFEGTFDSRAHQVLDHVVPIVAPYLRAREVATTESLLEPTGRVSIPEARPFDASRPSIRSSLSGILGSIELLRSERPRDAATTERYIDIIDRSARKISALVTPQEQDATRE